MYVYVTQPTGKPNFNLTGKSDIVNRENVEHHGGEKVPNLITKEDESRMTDRRKEEKLLYSMSIKERAFQRN